ncbi:tetratricopeptide repeat protein [bacterium]|nr:tetratricopeptide repeat protein [bacterium]
MAPVNRKALLSCGWSILLWTALVPGPQGRLSAQAWDAQLDSTFTPYSLPQLQNFRNYYSQELDRLLQEKTELIQRGIRDGELQLASNPDPKILDQILIRLADLYYYFEKDEYLLRMDNYDQLLEAYDEGTLQNLPEEPKLDFKKSLSLYQRIIDEFPRSELVDDAVYNKGFLLEEMSRKQEAVRVYMYFVEKYPDSKFIPDAYMRLGEFYFNPPENQLNRAILCYKEVTKHQDHARYDEALYKLGWSYYRLNQYPEAISYFTTLVENLYAMNTHEAPRDMRTDLLEEAMDYIAISFIDYGGPQKANQYLGQLKWPEWSINVLRRMGHVYKEQKEDYAQAVRTFDFLMQRLGNDPEAILIQKAIVDCYVALDDKEQIFIARQKIYDRFNPRTSWWLSIEDEKTKLDAYRIAENAMRNNFNTVLQRVSGQPSTDGYLSVIDLGYRYLDLFPEDSYAYMIRWNVAIILDTKLHLYKEALQEYLTISLVYSTETYEEFAREKGLASIRDAAQNAIVIADTLIAREKRDQPGPAQVTESQGTGAKAPVPLTEAQKWLAMAYDNYIKLFPFDEKTPAILSSAGALYYINNQYDEAIKYFKTLMRYFPEHEAAKQVELSILESYFAKNDFESTEALAKKILSGSSSSDIKLKARQRLGEAIFLRAQNMADKGQGVRAADEYYRLALEVPQVAFADRALFNSAQEYEKVHDYESAIRAYEILRSSYTASPHFNDALNNLAFDYSEVGKNRLSGDRYRELSGLAGDPQKAQDALHNAYIVYVKGRHWTQAIETANTFVNRFPKAQESEAIYYQVADHYGQLQQPDKRTQHLLSFMRRFPSSVFCIDASYQAAQYYQKTDSIALAEKYYRNTYTLWQTLKSDSLEEAYAFLATEGLFNATRMAHRRYEGIQFNVSPFAMSAQVAKKESDLRTLENQYTQIIAMKTIRLPESLYRIGELYDQYAVAWAKQSIPERDPTARALKEKQINERAARIFGQAQNAYILASSALRNLTDEVKNQKKTAEKGVAQTDSLAELTKTWMERSETKISATLYRIAQIHQESIQKLLDVPVPAELGALERLEYQSQLLLQAILPLTEQVIAAHKRNLEVADSLFITNTWTQASQKQILIHLSLVAEKYEPLAFEALRAFSKQAAVYRYRTLEKKQRMDQEFVDQMVNFLELSKTYGLSAVQFRKQGMQRAERMNVDMLPAAAHREAMDNFALSYSDSAAAGIGKARVDQRRATAFFEATQELMYEDMLSIFEDNEYFLNQARIAVLETAFEVEPGFQYQRPTRNNLSAALLRIDPDTYSKKWGIQLAIQVLTTDTSWTCSFQPAGAELKKDEGNVVAVKPHGQVVAGSDWGRVPVFQIWVAPPRRVSMLAFRKEMMIPGAPVSGEIRIESQSPCRIYVNGEVAVERAQNGEYDVTSRLRNGVNQIGFVYVDQPVYSVRGALTVRYIPKSL